jgi:Phosphotransferase enzyme family
MAARTADGATRPSRAFLASLHPSGDPQQIVTIDGSAGETRGDVVLLSLTQAQCGEAKRRSAMIARAVAALTPDGIMWVAAPGQCHATIAAELRAAGLTIGRPVAFRARGAASVEFPLTPRGLRFAIDRGYVSRRWRLVRYLPGARALLVRLLPEVGFSAFRPGTKPLGWLAQSGDADAAVITNWRGEQAPFLVFALGDETLVAKRAEKQFAAGITHEADMLQALSPGLAGAGLQVPRLVDRHRSRQFFSLVETDVPGRQMAALIREGHHRNLGAIVGRLTDWLSRWNRETIHRVELTWDLAERLILSAAREVAGKGYLDWLSRETAQLIGRKVPLVAAHNDLTMANVLGNSSATLSVVDWEAASGDGLPLADFRYGACDAAACLSGGDRLAAFRACFLEDGATRQLLQEQEARLRAIVGGPPQWLELCVHACWLAHAANEQARRSSRPDRAFIAIVELLGARVSA